MFSNVQNCSTGQSYSFHTLEQTNTNTHSILFRISVAQFGWLDNSMIANVHAPPNTQHKRNTLKCAFGSNTLIHKHTLRIPHTNKRTTQLAAYTSATALTNCKTDWTSTREVKKNCEQQRDIAYRGVTHISTKQYNTHTHITESNWIDVRARETVKTRWLFVLIFRSNSPSPHSYHQYRCVYYIIVFDVCVMDIEQFNCESHAAKRARCNSHYALRYMRQAQTHFVALPYTLHPHEPLRRWLRCVVSYCFCYFSTMVLLLFAHESVQIIGHHMSSSDTHECREKENRSIQKSPYAMPLAAKQPEQRAHQNTHPLRYYYYWHVAPLSPWSYPKTLLAATAGGWRSSHTVLICVCACAPISICENLFIPPLMCPHRSVCGCVWVFACRCLYKYISWCMRVSYGTFEMIFMIRGNDGYTKRNEPEIWDEIEKKRKHVHKLRNHIK